MNEQAQKHPMKLRHWALIIIAALVLEAMTSAGHRIACEGHNPSPSCRSLAQ